MPERRVATVDGNEAVASVAFRLSEVIAIYPITPASPMGELSDDWAVRGVTNLWGHTPLVSEMQSEGGAAGAVHGALQAGALATTFTASQGLLLMIPNMFKIAGELTPFCLHVAARSVATHALSIFGDHSDVMCCRTTGFALLASGSVQEAHDLAAIAHATTLLARVPFLHFFDGFRTSHEIAKIELLGDDDLRALLDEQAIARHRDRALTPDRPVLRGTAQNPDTFFQAREAANSFYEACPSLLESVMERFAAVTGRRYAPFEYFGHPEAERVLVIMGSGAETAHATVDALVERGERVGVVKVRLYRPLSAERLVAALPRSVRSVAVLDRTKEPGAQGEPLFLDVLAAISELWSGERPRVIGGRYGLSSKEFTPAMVRAVLAELERDRPKSRFTVGIVDDVTRLSLDWDPSFRLDASKLHQAVFWGLGSDGTVGANKNTIKIIGEDTDSHAQAYFVYDSKKAGAVTISHLRFGSEPIRAPYLVTEADFVACHQFELLERYDVLAVARQGAKFLLNSPHPPDELWSRLPAEVARAIRDKRLECFVVDAHAIAREHGLGGRINTVMQACFFALAGVLPVEEGMAHMTAWMKKSYGARGEEIVQRNIEAAAAALAALGRFEPPAEGACGPPRPPPVPDIAPDFVTRVTAAILAGQGDLLPVSAFPADGTFPTGTARWEKRNLAREIPVWDSALCIQCNKCALVCPHAAIRAKVYDPASLEAAPAGFSFALWKGGAPKGGAYTIQVAPEDCTGCGVCVAVCPAKDKSNPRHKAIDMQLQAPLREAERERYEFFLGLPPAAAGDPRDVKTSQLRDPLFEYSGACAGCGETPYIKLLTQLFGDRLLIANATGCSSIYGGNLPTTPYTVDREGRGPAWSNSLFEDNAEFGFGMRLALDHRRKAARALVKTVAADLGEELATALLDADQATDAGIHAQRERVALLRTRLAGSKRIEALRLVELADDLVEKSVWIVGGDGWAYDIGFGGLDHVLASDLDVNVLVLDTEVYSNTGGQASKSTPRGAAAKFAASGKATAKKDLGLIAMSYGHAYVAKVAFGAKDAQTVHALIEAQSYPGPSLVIAYSHCIAHGYDLVHGPRQQKLAVDSGAWSLFRFDPRRTERGEHPLELDSGPPKLSMLEYARNEARFRMVERADPSRFARLMDAAREDTRRRLVLYDQLAQFALPREK